MLSWFSLVGVNVYKRKWVFYHEVIFCDEPVIMMLFWQDLRVDHIIPTLERLLNPSVYHEIHNGVCTGMVHTALKLMYMEQNTKPVILWVICAGSMTMTCRALSVWSTIDLFWKCSQVKTICIPYIFQKICSRHLIPTLYNSACLLFLKRLSKQISSSIYNNVGTWHFF
jgi:hypothetical protein